MIKNQCKTIVTIVWASLVAIALCSFIGCEESTNPADYRALPAPAIECPPVNLPVSIRQKNFLGGQAGNEGSCAHASLMSCFHWLNKFDLAKKWRSQYNGGEYGSRMRERLDREGVKYAYTDDGSLELFDFAHNNRLGAILWWKPRHCCTFVGWVEDTRGTVYACILDNNSTAQFELTEKSQFKRLHDGYGGFALCPVGDPPSLPPYRSYERISARPN
jgi:hypothetical protein